MNKAVYLFYKLVNFIVMKIVFNSRKRSSSINLDKDFYFDFSHSSMHLGDRLFYLDTFFALSRNGKTIYVSHRDEKTKDIVSNIAPEIKIVAQCFDPDRFNLIVPEQSVLARLLKIYKATNYLVVKYSKKGEKNISWQLCDMLYVNYVPTSEALQKGTVDCKPSKVVMSNYIDSGFFRKLFVDEEKISQKVLDLKNDQLKVFHVGTQKDKIEDSKIYPFVDLDLRGQLSVADLITFVRDHRPVIVTYDNFIMHLGILFECEVHVLFRGRFSAAARDFHFKKVNETLRKENGHVKYL